MRILITGGAGFIGSHVGERLLREGHEIHVVDSLVGGKRENVAAGATLHVMDIRDAGIPALLQETRPEAVVHLAAQMDVRKSVDDPRYDADVNVMGSLNVLEAARAAGVGRFLFASTGGAIYGNPRELPATEETACRPLSPYGTSKLAFEHYLTLYDGLFGVPSTILRLPNVYGPRQDPHGEAGVVAIFAQTLLAGRECTIFGDGTKTRDYIFATDVAQAFFLALDRGISGTFNLGWGREVTDREVFDAVRVAVGVDVAPRHAPRRPGEIERISLDGSLARRVLGWEPRVAFDEGVRQAVAFYRAAV